MMLARTFFTLAIISVLTACASSEIATKNRYYILDDIAQKNATNGKIVDKSSVTKIRTVVVPSYLNQSNLVLKLNNHQIKIAHYHFWADDLRQSIQRILINDLNKHHSTISYASECITCDELVITIEHFYPTETGEVVLAGTYYNTNDYIHKNFLLQKELNQGGYDEAVAVMRNLLSELASKI